MKLDQYKRRIIILLLFFFCAYFIIITRLFYWQILTAAKTKELAWNQYRSQWQVPASRGEILANDLFPLVINKKAYLLYGLLSQLDHKVEEIADKLTPILLTSITSKEASPSGLVTKREDSLDKKIRENIIDKLKATNLVWIALEHKLFAEQKEQIEKLEIQGLGFEEEQVRFYPEASMAAHLLGFMGKDESGQDKGYFGLEGFYDLELKGRPGLLAVEKDAAARPIMIGSFVQREKQDGKTLVLYLDRMAQFIAEKRLKEALEKYGAKTGLVAIMDPYTGGIIAMTSLPSYNPSSYFEFDKSLFKNPVVAEPYEPGSTFKIFVMAAALDKKIVKPETKCDICQGPFKIDKYTIKTWNDEYYPDSTMTDVIQHSDNVGMVFIAQKMGLDNFWEYLNKFGFTQKTNIDLQEEVSASLKEKKQWSEVDLVTAAFGQGLALTPIQILRAVSVIANGGNLVEPRMVKEIISGDKTIKIKPKIGEQVIKPEAAKMVKEMMVNAVEKGEVKWTKIPGYKIAGKTGTAQIPIAGHYDEEKTIASFIGFAPADKPRFVMLTTLREPTTSPWGSETAAPLFFKIAKELLVYYGIQKESN